MPSPSTRRTVLKGIGGLSVLTLPSVTAAGDDAFFDVEIDSVLVSMAGEPIMLFFTVTNTGSAAGEQPITVSLGDFGSVHLHVSLDAGETETRDLLLDTARDHAGEHTLTVSSEDDEATQTLILEETRGRFDVEIDEVTEPLAGDPVVVDATVTNIGQVSDDATVTLDVHLVGSSSEQVSLAPGESTAVSLSLTTSLAFDGSYTALVTTPDASAQTDLEIHPAAAVFEVAIDEVGEPTAGDPVEGTVTVSNSGTIEETATVEFEVGDLGTDSQAVTVAPGGTEQVTVSVPTVEGDGGEYTATASVAESQASQSVTVTEAATDDEPPEADEDADADDDGVGFGVTSVLAGAGATVSYLLWRDAEDE